MPVWMRATSSAGWMGVVKMGAVDFRHHPIGQNDGEKLPVELLDSLTAVESRGDAETGFGERFPYHGSGNDIVVHHQNWILVFPSRLSAGL